MSISLETDLGQKRQQTAVSLCNLPPFHPVAVRLLGISTDSDSAMQDYAKAFGADPALGAELLRRANSAEFGQLCHIGDIKRAIVVLGLSRVRSLVFSISMSLYVRKQSRKVDVYPVWAHSMATAVLADYLCGGGGSGDANVYTAGLMHDLGRLGLLLSGGERYARILAGPTPNIEYEAQMEKSTFGMDHCESGVVMSANWKFPETLRECIRSHHSRKPAGRETLLGQVQLACRLAEALGFPEAPVEETADPLEVLPPELRGNARFAPDLLREMVAARLTEMWS